MYGGMVDTLFHDKGAVEIHVDRNLERHIKEIYIKLDIEIKTGK